MKTPVFRYPALVLILLAGTFFLSACSARSTQDYAASQPLTSGSSTQDQAQSGGRANEELSQSIHLRGSGTLMPLAEMAGEQVMAQNPQQLIVISGGGSSRGILSLIDGTCDIAMASAVISPELQRIADERGIQLEREVVACDAIVPFVRTDNPVSDLTLEQLRGIYTGQIADWSEIGGPEQPILIGSRNFSSGTYEAWKQLVLGPSAVISPEAVKLESRPLKDFILKQNGAIGYSAFSYIDQTVKPLSVNGVAPTRDQIERGLYPLSRDLYIYIRTDASSPVRDFVTRLKSTAKEQAEALGLFRIGG